MVTFRAVLTISLLAQATSTLGAAEIIVFLHGCAASVDASTHSRI